MYNLGLDLGTSFIKAANYKTMKKVTGGVGGSTVIKSILRIRE